MMWPIQLAFLHLLYVRYSCLHYLCVILLHFSHDQSNYLLYPSPAPHFKTFHVFLTYFPKYPSFNTIQSHIPNIALYYILLAESCFCHGSHGFNCPCTSCIMCYHATQIFEIFRILQLFLIYHNLQWGWLPWDSHHLSFSTFISIPQCLPISISLSITPCSMILPHTVAQDHLYISQCKLLVLFWSLQSLQKLPCLTPLSIFILFVSPGPVLVWHSDPLKTYWSIFLHANW